MRAIQCLIISIFAILSASGTAPWGGYLGKYLLQRPFIGGLICGIVFGDITQGILIGAAMQLVYIGYFNVGGVQSIDMGIISFPCVAIAMMSGIDTSAAIALATGLGALFTTLEMLCRTVFFPSAGALMKKGCEEADDRKIFLGYWVIPTGVYILTRGATSFLLMYFGADAVASVINMLPANIMSAISATGSWLPCIGIAVLLVFLSNSGWGLLVFAVGFAAYGYLGLTSTSILLFAVIFAYMYYRSSGANTAPATSDADDEEVL